MYFPRGTTLPLIQKHNFNDSQEGNIWTSPFWAGDFVSSMGAQPSLVHSKVYKVWQRKACYSTQSMYFPRGTTLPLSTLDAVFDLNYKNASQCMRTREMLHPAKMRQSENRYHWSSVNVRHLCSFHKPSQKQRLRIFVRVRLFRILCISEIKHYSTWMCENLMNAKLGLSYSRERARPTHPRVFII